MRTRTLIMTTIALVSLAGLGVATAHGGGLGFFRGGGPGGLPGDATATCNDDITVGECRAMRGDPCNDTMTVGECRAAWEAKRAELNAARQAECLKRHADDANAQQICAERGFPGHGRPGGHRGPGGPRGPPGPHGPASNSTADA